MTATSSRAALEHRGPAIQQLALFDSAVAQPQQIPLPLLCMADVVFVRTTKIVVVQSCAINAEFGTVSLQQSSIVAHAHPYCMKRGEHSVRFDDLSEATKLSALLALNQQRLQAQFIGQ